MNGSEFQQWALIFRSSFNEVQDERKTSARRNGLSWRYEPRKGKGSHGTFYLGNRRTVVQHGEIKIDTLMGMFRDLGIDRRRF